MTLSSKAGLGIFAVLLASAGAAIVFALVGEVPGAAQLSAELEGRGRIILVGGDALQGLSGEGTELVPLEDVPDVRRALGGNEERALVDALTAARAGGLLVSGHGRTAAGRDAEAEPATLEARLFGYGAFSHLRARYLAPSGALYLLREPSLELSPSYADAVANVARGILEGERPPRITSFPEPLRRFRNVEVLVMLREGGRPRLWRSARGSSVASALLTAASVARERWNEREAAMGAPLDRILSRLDVEVSLLEEDGTLGESTPGFVSRVFSREHGVAYQQKNAWRYLLPETTWENDRNAVQAYQQLFADHGLPEDSLGRADLRLYRLVTSDLARSPALSASVVPSPDEGSTADDRAP